MQEGRWALAQEVVSFRKHLLISLPLKPFQKNLCWELFPYASPLRLQHLSCRSLLSLAPFHFLKALARACKISCFRFGSLISLPSIFRTKFEHFRLDWVARTEFKVLARESETCTSTDELILASQSHHAREDDCNERDAGRSRGLVHTKHRKRAGISRQTKWISSFLAGTWSLSIWPQGTRHCLCPHRRVNADQRENEDYLSPDLLYLDVSFGQCTPE